MPSVVANNLVLDSWTVLNGTTGLPMTGMTVPADVTLSLARQSGSALVAASEVMAWTELGATGQYAISVTPANTGLYVLTLLEVNASSAQRRSEFRYTVYSAGAVLTPSYANAFCAETDIERWIQQPITSISKPSSTEAAAFAQGRAGVLMSLCAGVGFPVTPSTVVAGSRMETLLREANAIGSAYDYTCAATFGTGPSKTDRLDALESLWGYYCGEYQNGKFVPGYIQAEIRGNQVSLATDHVLSGEVAPWNPPLITDSGPQISTTDVF